MIEYEKICKCLKALIAMNAFKLMLYINIENNICIFFYSLLEAVQSLIYTNI